MQRITIGTVHSQQQPAAILAIVRLVAFSVIVGGIGSSSASAQRLELPPVPPNLKVDEGHEVFLAGHAVGTQNYLCLPADTETGVAWTFLGPQATVFGVTSGDARQQLTTHFLSFDPLGVKARPTWQHSIDSSRVWGRMKEFSDDPNFVEPGAIDWLLVERVAVDSGPIGSGLLAQTTYIHRVNTSGGVEPATGCSGAGNIGNVALVPYSTDYFFYRSRPAQ